MRAVRGFRVSVSGFGVQGMGFLVLGLGFWASVSGLGVLGVCFRVQGLELSILVGQEAFESRGGTEGQKGAGEHSLGGARCRSFRRSWLRLLGR